MFRLYWSNLPVATRPLGGANTLEKFVYERGLAYTGVAGDQHALDLAVCHNPIKCFNQSVDFRRTPKKLLGHYQPARGIIISEFEGVDMPVCHPIPQTSSEVAFDTRRSLISLLRSLGEQLHDDRGDRGGDILKPFIGRQRFSRHMAVNPFHGIGSLERKGPRQRLVERDARRIQIAARVDRAVHSSGLFGCHIGQRAGDHLWRFG